MKLRICSCFLIFSLLGSWISLATAAKLDLGAIDPAEVDQSLRIELYRLDRGQPAAPLQAVARQGWYRCWNVERIAVDFAKNA